MCGCSTHQAPSTNVVERELDVLTLNVEDMACGHCAGAITKAIQAGLPEAKVQADSATKIVRVSGTADLAAVRSLVVRAGYTPIEAMLA